MRTIAVIGGTGDLGFGLAARWARAGHAVVIGSREAAKAEDAARRASALAGATITGAPNAAAAATGEIVVLTIPFAAQAAILDGIRSAVGGKVVVDATVPLRQYAPPLLAEIPAGSAAAQAQTLLPAARVVAAFHTVSQALVRRLDRPLEGDVLVCGDDAAGKAEVITLVEALGMRGVDAGDLAQAATLERLGALLIGLNQRYRRKGIGVRLTGL